MDPTAMNAGYFVILFALLDGALHLAAPIMGKTVEEATDFFNVIFKGSAAHQGFDQRRRSRKNGASLLRRPHCNTTIDEVLDMSSRTGSLPSGHPKLTTAEIANISRLAQEHLKATAAAGLTATCDESAQTDEAAAPAAKRRRIGARRTPPPLPAPSTSPAEAVAIEKRATLLLALSKALGGFGNIVTTLGLTAPPEMAGPAANEQAAAVMLRQFRRNPNKYNVFALRRMIGDKAVQAAMGESQEWTTQGAGASKEKKADAQEVQQPGTPVARVSVKSTPDSVHKVDTTPASPAQQQVGEGAGGRGCRVRKETRGAAESKMQASAEAAPHSGQPKRASTGDDSAAKPSRSRRVRHQAAVHETLPAAAQRQQFSAAQQQEQPEQVKEENGPRRSSRGAKRPQRLIEVEDEGAVEMDQGRRSKVARTSSAHTADATTSSIQHDSTGCLAAQQPSEEVAAAAAAKQQKDQEQLQRKRRREGEGDKESGLPVEMPPLPPVHIKPSHHAPHNISDTNPAPCTPVRSGERRRKSRSPTPSPV